MAKKYWFLIIAIISILAVSIICSNCDRSEANSCFSSLKGGSNSELDSISGSLEDVSQSESDNDFKGLGNDYLLLEVIIMGFENISFRISKSGYVEYAEFSSCLISNHNYGLCIDTYKSGTISKEDMENLSKFIEDNRFSELKNSYLCPVDVDCEGGSRLSILLDGGVKSVYESCNEAPESFYDIINYLEDIILPKLESDHRTGSFIMARMVEAECSFLEIYAPGEDELKSQPFLDEAIQNDGWLIYSGPLNNTELEGYPLASNADYFQVKVDNELFNITVYEKTE